jgi:hypothetical protein
VNKPKASPRYEMKRKGESKRSGLFKTPYNPYSRKKIKRNF